MTLIPETPRERPVLRGRDLLLILVIALAAISLIGLLVAPLLDPLGPSEQRDATGVVGIQLLLLAARLLKEAGLPDGGMTPGN